MTTVDEQVDQRRHAAVRDLWDVEDWETALAEIPPVKELSHQLEDVTWVGPRGLADVYQTLLRPVPLVNQQVDPAYKVNRRIVETLMECDAVAELREFTVANPFVAGLTTSRMGERLVELYEELEEIQQQADDAQEKADEYDEACGDAGVEPGSAEAQADAALEAMRQAAAAADAAVDDALDAMGAVLDRDVRQAVEEGGEAAGDLGTSMAGWGLEPGEVSSMDPAARLALAERLMDPRMVRIAEMFGRLKAELWAETSRRWDVGHEEVDDVTYGDDITRVVSSELLYLADPDLEVLFEDAYLRKKLLVRTMRARAKEARGSIVYVEDSSSSMYENGGLPAIWARALGLVLLDVAIRQGRGFVAVVFSGPGTMEVFDFGLDASTATLDERMAYAEFVMKGGTELEGPLGKAIGFLVREYEETGRMTGDVVIGTDDICKVSPEWLAKWNEQKIELGFRAYGIGMGVPTHGALEQVADYCTEVSSLVDGSDVTEIFRAVSEQKELVA